MELLTSVDKDKLLIKSPRPLFRSAPETVVEVNELGRCVRTLFYGKGERL